MLKNTKKILFILPSAHCGGAEKVTIDVINNISSDEFNASLLFIDPEGPLIADIQKHITHTSLNKKRVRSSIFSLLKAIKQINPDIILTSIFHLNIAVLFLKPFISKNVKIIVRESNLPSIVLLRERYPIFFGFLIRLFYPKSDMVISLGQEMENDLINSFRVSPLKIKTIPNPVDLFRIQKLSKASGNPFDKFKYNFLAVGSLTPQKGFDILINSMALIANKCVNVHLTILGDGVLKHDLIDLISQKGLNQIITIGGYKENPYPYFYHADRFVLSSRYEGLPNVVLESLALGTPVIALDNPGCLRDIITNHQQGVLVKPCTANSLAREMISAYRIGSSIKKPSLLPDKFMIDHVINQYEELFAPA